jgi:hypothetical protein
MRNSNDFLLKKASRTIIGEKHEQRKRFGIARYKSVCSTIRRVNFNERPRRWQIYLDSRIKKAGENRNQQLSGVQLLN